MMGLREHTEDATDGVPLHQQISPLLGAPLSQQQSDIELRPVVQIRSEDFHIFLQLIFVLLTQGSRDHNVHTCVHAGVVQSRFLVATFTDGLMSYLRADEVVMRD